MTKTTIKISYEFDVEYEYTSHFAMILKELKKAPIFELGGAGLAENGKIGSYGCKLKQGSGELIGRDKK